MSHRAQQEQQELMRAADATPSAPPLPKGPTALSALAEALLLTVFPAACGACGVALCSRAQHRLCDACFAGLEPNDGARCSRCDAPGTAGLCGACAARPPAFAALRAPWIYGGALADVLVAVKFGEREDLAVACAHLVATDPAAWTLARDATALVPVPLGPRRQRSRGYNQSAIVARRLGRAWGKPVRYALQRARETERQSELPLAGRLANVRQAFCARAPLRGPVVLVDDIVTSAETVHDAARALLAAGATRVSVVAVARASLANRKR